MEKKQKEHRKCPKTIFFCISGMSFAATVYMVFKDPSFFMWDCYSLLTQFLFCFSCFLLCAIHNERKSRIIIAIKLISALGACFIAIQFVNVLRFGGFPSQ